MPEIIESCQLSEITDKARMGGCTKGVYACGRRASARCRCMMQKSCRKMSGYLC